MMNYLSSLFSNALFVLILVAFVFFAASVLRDGWPSFGPGRTQLCRIVSALICVAGGYLAVPNWTGAAYGLAVGLGFWTDRDHANGQQARDAEDALWLAVSGATSVVVLALLSGWLINPRVGIGVFAAGAVIKPLVWFAAWRAFSPGTHWAVPTRMAAGTFGALLGATVFALARASPPLW